MNGARDIIPGQDARHWLTAFTKSNLSKRPQSGTGSLPVVSDFTVQPRDSTLRAINKISLKKKALRSRSRPRAPIKKKKKKNKKRVITTKKVIRKRTRRRKDALS